MTALPASEALRPALPLPPAPFAADPPPFAASLAAQAYGGAAPVRTARAAEHQVLSTVTARLSAAQASPGDFPRRAHALHDNRMLWTRLAADVADADNGLPQELRARIFWLAEFTEHHSRRALRGEADLAALIEVNAAVMRGLGQSGGHLAPQGAPQPGLQSGPRSAAAR